jgi:hypothetical protein
MSKLSDNKLNKLSSMSSQGGFWYITKQNLVFRDLCFIAKILEKWGDRNDENYQTFFDNHKELSEFGGFPPLTAHRATKNCEYIGLIRPSDKYSAQSLTPFYFSLKKLCAGDFNKLSQYPQIIDKQLERIFIDSNNKIPYTESFNICPFMFIFKILLLIGDITKSYKISTSEFKLFVATAQKWSDYFEVTESILRYRNDDDYRLKCDNNSNKVADVRYNILAQNHSQLDVTKNEIAIKEGQIKNIRRKVAEYELNDTIQSVEDMYSANSFSINETLQQIFYGAPGTGKSDTIFERTKDLPKEDVYRTTFHPDSDYASFVGSYKPKMNDRTVYGAQGPLYNSKGEEISEPKITYTFSPQAFTNAYIRAWQTDEPVFLIIEEINRGNCAQIFGDLFQLLDRDENGYSKYDIVPDSDLSDYIKGKLEDAAEKEGLTSHIKEGKILKLPNNLYIWATMNTSDQSLFPIDSAFKRRWEWKYIKIKKGIDKKTGAELDWKIKVGEDNSYDWWEFLKAINYKIDKMTSSADKQLGYFFCLADRNGEINIDTFVNKVAFYLWNDVFKDYAEDGSPLLKYKKNEEDKSESDLTFPDFFDQSGEIDKNVVKQFIEKVMKEDDMEKPAE